MNTGKVTNLSFYSDALQEELRLLIYVPADYSPFHKYNVLIASDGKDYFQLGGIARLADKLIEEYEIENTIIVGVPYKSIADRRVKYLPTGEKHEAYLHFLAHELLPLLNEEYSIHPSASTRGLIGDSMAATVSLLAALKYPELFGKVIMQSPYVDDLIMAQVAEFPTPESISIYHVIGTEETKVATTDKIVKDFLTPNRALHDLILQKGYHSFYDEFQGNHTWKYWKPDLKRALIENFSS